MALINEGKYRARALGGTLGETKKGDPQVVVEFHLLDENSSILWYGYFTEKTQERTVQTLRTCGWTGNDLSDLSELATRNDLPEVELVVEHSEYNGKVSAKVAWVNVPGAVGAAKSLAPDKARAFAARMRATIAVVDSKHGTVPAAPPAPVRSLPPPASAQKADIPF